MTLHGYWRSTTTYRVRIALNLKRLRYEQVTHDLLAGAQHDPAYRAIAPQGLVPILDTGDAMLAQSPAIIEWLEERHPQPALLPAGATDRAIVRGMAAAIGCDIHPLNNLRVLNTLRDELGAAGEQRAAWTARWIAAGFAALEQLIGRHGRGFAFGDTPSVADCYLVPQLYSAERFSVDLSPYPALVAAAARARTLQPFADAHPDRQPGADRRPAGLSGLPDASGGPA